MAVNLESEIMNAIGLGSDYNWFNGSSSCAYIRKEAVKRLPQAIKDQITAGQKIAEPEHNLMKIAISVALNEPRDTTLTKTWEVCSYLIQIHIELAYTAEDKREAVLTKWIEELRKHYIPKPRVDQRGYFAGWE